MSDQAVSRWPAAKAKHGSGHRKYRVREFLLVGVSTGERTINLRYCFIAYSRLRRISSSSYVKTILEVLRLFS